MEEGEHLAAVGEKLPRGAHCVEVGSFLGRSAAAFLSRAPHLDLLCIDTFDGTGTVREAEMRALGPQINLARMEEEVARVIGRGSVYPVISSSIEAALRIEDEDVDYFFLDADHSYHAVTLDLRAWWPKLKPGAVMYGHDYHHTWPTVVKAVDDFFQGRKVERWADSIWGVRK